jgi:hypothetical protein
MSEEAKKDRSRNCPNIALASAIEFAKKLYEKAGKAKVRAEVAVNALGYAGLNGAALTTLGALSQYGLIDREKGSIVSISPQAIRLIHPLNKEQETQTLRELALNPKVFAELYAEGFQNGTEDLIANHLIQNGFTPNRARKVSTVFKTNIELSCLKGDSIVLQDETKDDMVKSAMKFGEGLKLGVSPAAFTPTIGLPRPSQQAATPVLARYSVPLGENEATIEFTGTKLTPEDFDGLADYVKIFKAQFLRKKELEAKAIKDTKSMKAAGEDISRAASQDLALAG